MITLLVWGMLLAVQDDRAPEKSVIRLEGIVPAEAGAFEHIAIAIHAPWLDGHVELRAPETLSSSLGLHFIDHRRVDMPPLSTLETVPKWERDSGTGTLQYWAITKEGVGFGAVATPANKGVAVTMKVHNGTSQRLDNVSCQMCLVLTPAKSLGQRRDLSRTHAWVAGQWSSLATATPTPETMGRRPWVLMLTDAMAPSYPGPRVNHDGWWVVDQTSEYPLIARQTQDGKHLVGIAWNETRSFLMTNTNIPCLHAGPVSHLVAAPGEQVQWDGKVYLMENDPAALLEAYRRDVADWREKKPPAEQ